MNRNCGRTEFRMRALLCVLLFITAGVAVIFATGIGERESRNAFGIVNGSSKIAPWVIEHTDPEAIDDMKHPERSPYACLGPKGAKHGCDRSFLLSPELRPARVTLPNLTAPLSWRKDGSSLPPRVAKMARDFGYH